MRSSICIIFSWLNNFNYIYPRKRVNNYLIGSALKSLSISTQKISRELIIKFLFDISFTDKAYI